ncbi:UDP-N-acetylglucosamine 1-carboxyvinyltransferase [Candidatus Absconditicoccus praedator]|uniref:UDP-N-acetylglucosamine 1-carboxyvinyltransferase n=1 Tax=Candidatus Absconditicoccus praedator TaxID=2735562 RepID=UPI001E483C51|nr:UDP-N-acetylglucosamine 1-carboxyvinyltransferase [Candidatus Absconditicoccus praedator]UFX83467.1 UDP-N-acetylglucosamine 1-carboxyvinyltransferase [Candidatus Absconditicoccus praedator]
MFKIKNSKKLNGTVRISGSKNAALPIVAANQIINNSIELVNKPRIKDLQILEEIATSAEKKSKKFYDLKGQKVNQIRSSILLIPNGLIKFGKVIFSQPGGCKIGKRSLDTFDDAFLQAGISIKLQNGKKEYKKTGKPQKRIILKEFSVTTTESILTYLSFLKDIDYTIKIEQVAIEPHVINLIEFLKTIGAKIKINYDHSILITPTRTKIKKDEFKIIGDYIEAGTFFAIGAITDDSEIKITGFNIKDLTAVLATADKIGINYKIVNNNTIIVNSKNKNKYKPISLQTQIYPGFPTDLQSIFGVVLTQIKGISKIHETIFEGRFAYLAELENVGANIEILNPHQVIIIGKTKLHGDYLSSTDLRGGGAMLLAGILAKGTSYITNENIILRGYEDIDKKLKKIGVDIEKV